MYIDEGTNKLFKNQKKSNKATFVDLEPVCDLHKVISIFLTNSKKYCKVKKKTQLAQFELFFFFQTKSNLNSIITGCVK